MITPEKLAVYRKFGGDDDGWSRAGCPKGDIFEDGDWYAIRNLLQEVGMLKLNLVSREYEKQIRQRLSEMTSDPNTVQALFEMA
jgi:hypothetical protein